MSSNERESLNLNIDTKQLDELQKQFGSLSGQLANSVRFSMKRVETAAGARIAKIVPHHFDITSTNVKNVSNISQSIVTVQNESALAIKVTGKKLTQARFYYSPKTPPMRKGMRVRQKKVRGRIKKFKPVETLTGIVGKDGETKKPFIAPTGTANKEKITYNVFVRTGKPSKKKKYKETIRPFYTNLSVPDMVTDAGAKEEIENYLAEIFDKNMQHEVERRLNCVADEVKKA